MCSLPDRLPVQTDHCLVSLVEKLIYASLDSFARHAAAIITPARDHVKPAMHDDGVVCDSDHRQVRLLLPTAKVLKLCTPTP